MPRRKQAHCKRGHVLEGANVGQRRDGTRWCRACDHARSHTRAGDAPRYLPWTTQDIALLERQYPTRNTRELAATLGRTPAVVRQYASQRGIRKEQNA